MRLILHRRSIINNLVYDTSTAEEICTVTSCWEDEMRFTIETLYRTKRGRYFLHGEGGPLSEYGVYVGNTTTAGSWVIRPLTEDQARKFCQEVDTKKALEIWGEYYEEA